MSLFDSRWFQPLRDAVRTLVLDDDTEYPTPGPTLPPDRLCLVGDPPVLVAWASQTGAAEAFAQAAVERLEAAGVAARSVGLDDLQLSLLEATKTALFLVSTTYDGDPPDMAEAFRDEVMARRATLPQLHYALLALGDRCYDNFCGFGRQLRAWLEASGAQACFTPIEVDDEDEQTLACWWDQLDALLPDAAHVAPAASATAR